MAQLRDTVVQGSLRVTDSLYTSTLQTTIIKASSTSSGSDYSAGTAGYVLKSGGASGTVYWAADSQGVTSVRVQATSPVVSSVNTAQSSTLNTTISLADNYGDTKNPYASKTKNTVLAAGASADSVPSFRALEASDIPTLTPSKVGLGNVSNNANLNSTTGTKGDIIYWSAANTPSHLGITSTTTKQFLSNTSQVPSWTTLSKVDIGLDQVENTKLSTWAGSTSITTLGTITSGTWNGSAIGSSYVDFNYAGSASKGGAATSANGLNFVHTNELLLGNTNSQSGIHINHRRVSGGATSGNTAITDYYFKNGNGAVTGVTVHAGSFDGTIALSKITDADDLKAIEALTGTSGILKKTAANTWTLDTTNYTTNTGTVISITPGNGLINGTSGTSQTAITTSGTISIKQGGVTNAMLAGSIDNSKLSNSTITIGGNSVALGGSISLADLGLDSAMHYRGTVAAIPPASGTYVSGDVVVLSGTVKEYVYDGTNWRELGTEGSYKTKQTAYSDSTGTSEDTTATRFVYSISQTADGIVSFKTRPLPTYNNYSLPVAKYNTLGGLKPAYTSTNAATLTTTAASNTDTPTVAAKSTSTGRYYAVEADKNGIAYVNVPWTNVNSSYLTGVTTTVTGDGNAFTAVSASGGTITFTKGLTFLTSHRTYTAFTGKPTGNQTPDFGSTFTIQQISQSTTGQVSGTDRTVTIPGTIATNTAKGLVKPWYTHTAASTGPTTGNNSTAVAVNAISTTAGKYYAVEADSEGRLFVNVPWTNVNSSYVAKTDGVTAVSWVNDSKTLTRTINGTAANVVSFVPSGGLTMTATSTNLTVDGSALQIEILRD